MAEGDENIIKQIMEYKNKLEKSEDSDEKMNIIDLLDKLPIQVSHLEKTGIGKTVNNLRKYDLDENIVVAARELKDKWKAMALDFWRSEEKIDTKCSVEEFYSS